MCQNMIEKINKLLFSRSRYKTSAVAHQSGKGYKAISEQFKVQLATMRKWKTCRTEAIKVVDFLKNAGDCTICFTVKAKLGHTTGQWSQTQQQI